MPLNSPIPFRKDMSDPNKEEPVNTGSEVPKEYDIFYRSEASFLPEGKTFDDLTEEEEKILKLKYRFDLLKSGCYQGPTGFSGSI